MEYIARPAPVGQGHLDQLVDRVAEQYAELPDALVVRAVAAADCDRARCRATRRRRLRACLAARCGRRRECPTSLNAARLRGRLARPQGLPHRAEDDAAVADDRRIARVQRVEADALALRQRENLCAALADQRQEAVVLLNRPRQVRRRREPKVAPLGFDGRRVRRKPLVGCLTTTRTMRSTSVSAGLEVLVMPGGMSPGDYIDGAPARPMRVLRTVKSMGFVR